MGDLLANLIAGVFSNLISDGIEAGTEYILSKRDVEFELRRAVEGLQYRQTNLEGAIERLVNNQNILLNTINEMIQYYKLSSKVYSENDNLVIITNGEDANLISNHRTGMSIRDFKMISDEDKFGSYREYVKRMRG